MLHCVEFIVLLACTINPVEMQVDVVIVLWVEEDVEGGVECNSCSSLGGKKHKNMREIQNVFDEI